MKTFKKRVVTTHVMITFYGLTRKLNAVYHVLSALSEVDGYMSAVNLDDLELKKILEKRGLIGTSCQGGSYPCMHDCGYKFKGFYEKIKKLWIKEILN